MRIKTFTESIDEARISNVASYKKEDFLTVEEYKDMGGSLEPGIALYGLGKTKTLHHKTGVFVRHEDDMVVINNSRTREFQAYDDLIYVKVEIECKVLSILND